MSSRKKLHGAYVYDPLLAQSPSSFVNTVCDTIISVQTLECACMIFKSDEF